MPHFPNDNIPQSIRARLEQPHTVEIVDSPGRIRPNGLGVCKGVLYFRAGEGKAQVIGSSTGGGVSTTVVAAGLTAHHTTHENGGTDEISIAGLSGEVADGQKSLVSSNDTTGGYLNGKLTAGANISLTEGSDGGDETLAIAVTGITTHDAVTLGASSDAALALDGQELTLTLPDGISSIDDDTPTTLTGILKGNGSTVSAAVAGTDYSTILESYIPFDVGIDVVVQL